MVYKSLKVGPLPPPVVTDYFRRALPAAKVRSLNVLFGVRSTCQQVENIVQLWLGADAMSPSRMHIMMVLQAAGEPVPQAQIVDALKVSRATVSNLIDTLLRSGHITSVSDDSDRRRSLVALTRQGEVLARQMMESNAARLTKALSGLSAAEQTELIRLLSLVRSSFERHGRDA